MGQRFFVVPLIVASSVFFVWSKLEPHFVILCGVVSEIPPSTSWYRSASYRLNLTKLFYGSQHELYYAEWENFNNVNFSFQHPRHGFNLMMFPLHSWSLMMMIGVLEFGLRIVLVKAWTSGKLSEGHSQNDHDIVPLVIDFTYFDLTRLFKKSLLEAHEVVAQVTAWGPIMLALAPVSGTTEQDIE